MKKIFRVTLARVYDLADTCQHVLDVEADDIPTAIRKAKRAERKRNKVSGLDCYRVARSCILSITTDEI